MAQYGVSAYSFIEVVVIAFLTKYFNHSTSLESTGLIVGMNALCLQQRTGHNTMEIQRLRVRSTIV